MLPLRPFFGVWSWLSAQKMVSSLGMAAPVTSLTMSFLTISWLFKSRFLWDGESCSSDTHCHLLSNCRITNWSRNNATLLVTFLGGQKITNNPSRSTKRRDNEIQPIIIWDARKQLGFMGKYINKNILSIPNNLKYRYIDIYTYLCIIGDLPTNRANTF